MKRRRKMNLSPIEKAYQDARELERQYGGAVVWMGGNRYIVIKDGKETRIDTRPAGAKQP